MTKIYAYKNCDTCRKAVKFLEQKGISYQTIPVREQPPSKVELEKMLSLYDGNIRKLFNTSGQDYKKANLKKTLPVLSKNQALVLLAKNGNLVRRPFLLTAKGGCVGFDESRWAQLF